MQRTRPRLTAALAGLALTLAFGGVARTQTPAPEESPRPVGPAVVEADGEQAIIMDFQDVDLPVLVKFIGEITGRNFVMDDRVQGKVTVVSPTKITPDEAYQLFQAVLQVKGFTTVPSGAAIRIIPTKEARATSLRTFTDPAGELPSEEYVTRMIPLAQVDVADLINVIKPMVSADGLVTGYPETNSLIVVDTAANLERITRLVEALDVSVSRRQTRLVRVEHADAVELADTVQQVLEEQAAARGAQAGQPAAGAGQLRAFRITPDVRTNTLVVHAPPEQLRQILELIALLDVPLPPGTGRIHVYYLKYANAEDMLAVLLDVVGATGSAAQARRAVATRSRGGSERGRAAQARRGQPASPVRRAQGQTGVASPQFAGEVGITADPATNALIITASPEDYATLFGVIEKLDIRRRQVAVEAIILEVTLDGLERLGIELQGATGLSRGVAVARTNFGALNQALTNPAALPGLIGAVLSERTVELQDGTRIPAQVALLTALQNTTDVNVLSAPNILTTDNEEAEIIVAQNVPFVASRATSETDLANTFTTIEREDVGIILRLTPQISEGSIVRLAVFEEVSALVPNPLLDAAEVGPTTTVRSASTVITVADGQTVVIGGLISDGISVTEQRVPFLSQIPVLGHLFTATDTQNQKVNLLIFLTPHIIKDEADAATMSGRQRDRFRDLRDDLGTPAHSPDPLDMPSFELQDSAAGVERSGLELAGVYVDRSGGETVVTLDVAHAPARVHHFALHDPGRYVVDVYGASARRETVQVLRIADPLVERARVAHHDGRMRVVLDLTSAAAPAYALGTRGGTIALSLGPTDAAPEQ